MLECRTYAGPDVSSAISLHCLLCLLHNKVVVYLMLWRSLCDRRACTSLQFVESARTLVVLDVDGQIERFSVKKTHTQMHPLLRRTKSEAVELKKDSMYIYNYYCGAFIQVSPSGCGCLAIPRAPQVEKGGRTQNAGVPLVSMSVQIGFAAAAVVVPLLLLWCLLADAFEIQRKCSGDELLLLLLLLLL